MKNPLEGFRGEVYQNGLTRHRSLFVSMHVLTDPEGMSEVLIKKANTFRKSKLNQRIIEPVTKDGLITTHGEQWKAQRRTLAPIFQARHMETLSAHVVSALGAFTARHNRKEQLIDVKAAMSDLTFDILAKALLGDPKGLEGDRLKAAANTAISVAGTLRIDDFLPLPDWFPRILGPKTYAAIKTMRRAALKLLKDRQDRSSHGDLIDLLRHSHDPKTNRSLTLTEQADNLIGFFIAGHESTAVALTWALYLLASHPDTQRRIREEVKAVAGDETLSYRHVTDLNFTKAVFNETMRLYPSIPIIGREARCDTQILAQTIKKDDIVVMPIYVMHRSPRHWQNADRFDPDRFIREPHLTKRNPKFMPFGAGPRVCIGASFAMMESILTLANMVRSFDLSVYSKTAPKPCVAVSLRPDTDIILRAVRLGPSERAG